MNPLKALYYSIKNETKSSAQTIDSIQACKLRIQKKYKFKYFINNAKSFYEYC